MAGQQVTRTTLKLIRIALLGGVLLFGGAVWFIQRTGPPDPLAADAARVLRTGFAVLMLSTAAGLIGIRRVAERAAGFQAAARYAVVAWALAEGLALLGAVAYLLTASPSLYVIGTVVLLVAYVLVPVPEER